MCFRNFDPASGYFLTYCQTAIPNHQNRTAMYRNVLLFLCFILSAFALRAQVVYSEPASPTADEEVTIFFDASQGDRGLENCNCDVYLHTGVITSQSSGSSDWRYVPTVWGQANPDWRLTPVSGQNNLYSFTFTPSIRAFSAFRVRRGYNNWPSFSATPPAASRAAPPAAATYSWMYSTGARCCKALIPPWLSSKPAKPFRSW